jgi:hypothetical protein
MIKDVFASIWAAARKIFTNWGAMLISFFLYAALQSVLYLLITTREATLLQLLLTFALPLVALILFFTLQALGLSYIRIGVGPGYLLKRALKDCWKLLLMSIPLILLAWLIIYSIGTTENRLLNQIADAAQSSGKWKLTALNWARMFLLYFALPLIAIHLWISTLHEGVGASIKSIGRSVARAFSPRSMLIYLLVVAVFGAISYFLFFTKTPVDNQWAELWLFGTRLAMALVSVFLGWLLTLGSLAELTAHWAMSELETAPRGVTGDPSSLTE